MEVDLRRVPNWLKYLATGAENADITASSKPAAIAAVGTISRFPHKNAMNGLYFDGHVGLRHMNNSGLDKEWVDDDVQ